MLVENDSWASNVATISDSPEANVLFTARGKLGVVNGWEFEAKDVKFRNLSSNDIRFLASLDSWDIPNNDEFFVMGVFANACKVLSVMREAEALKRDNRHGHHSNAPSCCVVPDPDDAVFALLRWSNHGSRLIEVESADRSWVSKEEAFLLVGFRVHRNDSASGCEQHNVLSLLSAPLDVQALISLVPDDVLQLHYWIFV